MFLRLLWGISALLAVGAMVPAFSDDSLSAPHAPTDVTFGAFCLSDLGIFAPDRPALQKFPKKAEDLGSFKSPDEPEPEPAQAEAPPVAVLTNEPNFSAYRMVFSNFAAGGQGRVHVMFDAERNEVIVKEPLSLSASDNDNAVGRIRAEATTYQRLEKVDDEAMKVPAGEKINPHDLIHRRYFTEGVRIIEPAPDAAQAEQVPRIGMNAVPKVPGSLAKGVVVQVAPTLYDRLRARGPDGKPNDPVLSDPNQRTFIVRQLLKAYEAMHRARVLHGDAKPPNTLVDDAGGVRVIDMGLAWVEEKAPLGLADGRVVGTLDYVSLDQMKGKPLSEADDLYALRKMIWEIVAYPHGLGPSASTSDSTVGPGKFRRLYDGSKAKKLYAWELKNAPEFDGVDPRLALAVWGKWAHTVPEYEKGIELALDQNTSDADFYNHIFDQINQQDSAPSDPKHELYHQKVKEMSAMAFKRWYFDELRRTGVSVELIPLPFPRAKEAVVSILGSKAAIAQFPGNLTAEKRDAVIRSAYDAYEKTKHLREPGVDIGLLDMPFLHWEPFFKRVKELGLDPKIYKNENRINEEISWLQHQISEQR
jgi:Protein kinase domain